MGSTCDSFWDSWDLTVVLYIECRKWLVEVGDRDSMYRAFVCLSSLRCTVCTYNEYVYQNEWSERRGRRRREN